MISSAISLPLLIDQSLPLDEIQQLLQKLERKKPLCWVPRWGTPRWWNHGWGRSWRRRPNRVHLPSAREFAIWGKTHTRHSHPKARSGKRKLEVRNIEWVEKRISSDRETLRSLLRADEILNKSWKRVVCGEEVRFVIRSSLMSSGVGW